MSNYSVSATQLTEGTTVLVRGQLGFSRLTRLIEGEELLQSDQRKQQNGMNPVNRPHTTATVTQAEVLYADPDHPTIDEQFVAERRYHSKRKPETGLNYSIDSKGSTLPVIAIPAAAGDGTVDQDTSGRELAQDLDVTLVLRVYKPKNFHNRGLALEQVIVNEAPRYFSAGGVGIEELAARGIVFNTPPRAVQVSEASPVGAAAPVRTTTGEDGLSFPRPQPTAVAAPVAAASAPEDQAVARAQPQAPAAPAAVPVRQAETPQQKLARLEAENAALKNAGSAVGELAGASPWGGPAGITYQGQG